MTQEDKSLLFKDLCGRLPYGVMIQYHTDYDWKPVEMYEISCDAFNGTYSLELCKPYLRPMSSMTEEEEFILDETRCWTQLTLESYDWLLEHHFDYRGLIEKGLAIEVTKENNPYEN